MSRQDLATQRRQTMSWCQRKTVSGVTSNRRHMTDDHHGRTGGRATLLVRAVDEILGTHDMTGEHHGYSAGRATVLVKAVDEILGTHTR